MNEVPDRPELLLRERAWLHALARQLVQRHEPADELAHDVMAVACTQAAPRTAGPRAWLAAILRKQLAGRRREAHRRSAREAQAARPEAVPPAGDTVARFEVQRDVANAVLALSEPYRTTVLLRFWEELSPAAIGRRMSVPVETVRTRIKRGLALLRERLDRAHGGDRRAWAVPLWAAGKAGSFASFLAGVMVMTSIQKVALGGAAIAAVLLSFLAWPWVMTGDSPAPASEPPSKAVSAAAPAGAVFEPVVRPDANERVAVTTAMAEAQLVVIGKVVDDETSAPLPGARVRLTDQDFTEDLGIVAATAADGTFRLEEAKSSPGRSVVVQLSDYAVMRESAPFDANAAAPQQVDLGTIRLVRGTVFSGQVVDQDGRGVADAELFLAVWSFGYSGYGPQNLLEASAIVGRGDADGRFRLDQPVRPDLQHQSLLFAVTPRGLGWCRCEASRQRREVNDLLIRLRPAGGVLVRVQDRDGKVVAGVQVSALPRFGPIGMQTREGRRPPSRQPALAARFSGQTDAAGEVRLTFLPVGEPLVVEQQGYHERLYDLSIEAGGHPQQPLHPFELQAGTEQTVTVRLVDTSSIAVSVEVRDDLGAPIADARVDAGETRNVEARTDAAGRAELTVPATSSISVAAEAPGHRRAHQQVKLAAGASVRVSLTLPRTCPLDGRVVDQFGAPVAGMFLFVDGHHLGTTDAEGRFHADAFPMGSRELGVVMGPTMDRTRWTGRQTPKVVDAGQGPVTITMQRRTGSVDVQVAIVDAGGQGLESIETNLALFTDEARGGFFLFKEPAVKRGLVLARSCVAGRWRLCVRTADGRRGSLIFAVTEGQLPTDLRLELPVPGTVNGRLQFVDVPPPANVTLHVRHATIEPGMWTSFRYPGRWHVDARSQSVTGDQNGWTGSLRMQPAQDLTFRVDSADPTEELVFTVIGEGVAGEARVRVEPGQTRDVVVEVRAKARPR